MDKEFKRETPIFDQMAFESLAVLLRRLAAAPSHKRRKELFLEFINLWRKYHHDRRQSKIPLCEADGFFTVCRLLLPSEDLDRAAYGLKEQKLAKLIAEVMGLPKGSPAEQKLLSANAIISNKPVIATSEHFNLPDVVCEVLREMHHVPRGFISVWKVDRFLDSLSRSHDNSVKNEMRAILNGLTPEASKWFTAIILENITFGLSAETILSLYHPDAADLFMFQSDLKHICETCADKGHRLNSSEIKSCKLFVWCHPMLSERVNIAEIDNHLKGAEFFIETKYDGERFQLHKQGTSFKYYSKNGFTNFTSKFGENFNEGTLTPSLREAFDETADEVILDGEMMWFDVANNDFIPKGRTSSDVKRQHGNVVTSQNHDDCFVVFDILLLNGKQLNNCPFNKRLEMLHKVVRPVAKKLIFAECSAAGKNSEGIAEALRIAMERGDEGLIVKKADSFYQAGVRFHGGWFKIKPDYSDQLVDTLDLLVMGADYGFGRYRDILRSFYCGVRQIVDGTVQFLVVTVVGTGCNDETLNKINLRLRPFSNSTRQSVISSLNFAGKKPAFWFKPEDSVVFRVKASEVSPSKEYPLKLSLRFPRFRDLRSSSESNYLNCMTSDEFFALGVGPLGKRNLTSGEIALASDGLPSKRQRASAGARRKVRTVTGTELLPAKRLNSKASSSASELAGKQICLLNAPSTRSKQIIAKLADFGADFTLRPIEGQTHFIVAYKKDIIVQSYIKQNLWDIFTGDWFDRCITSNVFFTPILLSDFLHVTPTTRRVIADKFGNSFSVVESAEEVRESMETMRQNPNFKHLETHEIDSMYEELGLCQSKYHLFRRLTAYFSEANCDHYTDNQFHFVLYGGKLARDIDESGITHCVIDESCKRKEELCDLCLRRHIHVVTPSWIYASVNDNHVVEERFHRP